MRLICGNAANINRIFVTTATTFSLGKSGAVYGTGGGERRVIHATHCSIALAAATVVDRLGIF